MKIKAKELWMRSDIMEAYRREIRLIDNEIKELRRRRNELSTITNQARRVSRRAYILMNTKGEAAAKRFAQAAEEGRILSRRILDLRGYCNLYSEFSNRHIDLWVTLGQRPLD